MTEQMDRNCSKKRNKKRLKAQDKTKHMKQQGSATRFLTKPTMRTWILANEAVSNNVLKFEKQL